MGSSNKYIYYDAQFDRVFLTDLQHHQSFGRCFYPAHSIFYVGEL